jgi:hypothetical protein
MRSWGLKPFGSMKGMSGERGTRLGAYQVFCSVLSCTLRANISRWIPLPLLGLA